MENTKKLTNFELNEVYCKEKLNIMIYVDCDPEDHFLYLK